MNDTKSAISSTGLQGAAVATVLGIVHLLKSFGIDIDLDDGQVTELVLALGLIVSSIVAFWGRLKATHKIG